MARKSKLSVSLFTLVACGLAILAAVLFLLPMLRFDGSLLLKAHSFSGFDLAFGADGVEGVNGTKTVAAVLISFILLVLGVLLLAARLIAKKQSKLFGLIAACLFVVAGVLVFFAKADFINVNEISSSSEGYYSTMVGTYFVAISAIAAGAFTALDSVK